MVPRLAAYTSGTFHPALPWDALIPCVPSMLWIYLFGVLIPLLPAWLLRGEAFLRAVRAYAILIVASTAAFILLPTDATALRLACPPHEVLDTLYAIDMGTNLFPSMHVGFATLAALCLRSVGSHWTGAFFFAALLQAAAACLVKQHYSADVLGGAALAWGAHALAFRSSLPVSTIEPASIQPNSRK
jgi:membrane-associated phospholipid phosphatase